MKTVKNKKKVIKKDKTALSLCAQLAARTHDPEIKSIMLYRLDKSGNFLTIVQNIYIHVHHIKKGKKHKNVLNSLSEDKTNNLQIIRRKAAPPAMTGRKIPIQNLDAALR